MRRRNLLIFPGDRFKMLDGPAGSLEGRRLNDGWTVLEKKTRKKTSTGGHFSVGYIVSNDDGRKAFLKALDFSRATQEDDWFRALEKMLSEYNFERDLLDLCKERHLSRIMIPIADGAITVPGFGELGSVHYLIFDLADGDVRDIIDEFEKIDVVWCLRSLHHVATAIKQLHWNKIAHQDIKPSNVLFIAKDGSRLSDLGRSFSADLHSPNDKAQVSGDRGYAPLDLWYPDAHGQSSEKRFLTDLFLLGSLVFYYFSGVSAAQATRLKLDAEIEMKSFPQDLPYIQRAFGLALADLSKSLHQITPYCAEELIEITRQLCEPDPGKRGDPRWRESGVPNYTVETYISRFDRLAATHARK